jgi:dienelactone hydrolase
MKKLLGSLFCFFAFSLLQGQSMNDFQGETIHFNSSDDVKITADLYMTSNSKAPFIILYHQAGYSRGEYLSIAPQLNALGFNCMAIDQRSGDSVNKVPNETHKEAVAMNKPTEYLDAIEDIESAYLYVKYGIQPEKIILWGSSYSAAIMFYMGSVHHDNLSGLLAFSPGEYFKINRKEIKSYASKVTCPVFVTSAKSEYQQWKSIYASVKSDKSYFLPETEGKHGSKALWNDNPNHAAYWSAVKEFLHQLK